MKEREKQNKTKERENRKVEREKSIKMIKEMLINRKVKGITKLKEKERM